MDRKIVLKAADLIGREASLTSKIADLKDGTATFVTVDTTRDKKTMGKVGFDLNPRIFNALVSAVEQEVEKIKQELIDLGVTDEQG